MKIFSRTIFIMQSNTWKYFPFPKIAFSKNTYFSKNILHWTKHNISDFYTVLEYVLCSSICAAYTLHTSAQRSMYNESHINFYLFIYCFLRIKWQPHPQIWIPRGNMVRNQKKKNLWIPLFTVATWVGHADLGTLGDTPKRHVLLCVLCVC